jgi:hypothetical protein
VFFQRLVVFLSPHGSMKISTRHKLFLYGMFSAMWLPLNQTGYYAHNQTTYTSTYNCNNNFYLNYFPFPWINPPTGFCSDLQSSKPNCILCSPLQIENYCYKTNKNTHITLQRITNMDQDQSVSIVTGCKLDTQSLDPGWDREIGILLLTTCPGWF